MPLVLDTTPCCFFPELPRTWQGWSAWHNSTQSYLVNHPEQSRNTSMIYLMMIPDFFFRIKELFPPRLFAQLIHVLKKTVKYFETEPAGTTPRVIPMTMARAKSLLTLQPRSQLLTAKVVPYKGWLDRVDQWEEVYKREEEGVIVIPQELVDISNDGWAKRLYTIRWFDSLSPEEKERAITATRARQAETKRRQADSIASIWVPQASPSPRPVQSGPSKLPLKPSNTQTLSTSTCHPRSNQGNKTFPIPIPTLITGNRPPPSPIPKSSPLLKRDRKSLRTHSTLISTDRSDLPGKKLGVKSTPSMSSCTSTGKEDKENLDMGEGPFRCGGFELTPCSVIEGGVEDVRFHARGKKRVLKRAGVEGRARGVIRDGPGSGMGVEQGREKREGWRDRLERLD